MVDAVAHQTAAARRISQRLERCDAVPLRTRERGVSSWVVNTSVRLIGLDGGRIVEEGPHSPLSVRDGDLGTAAIQRDVGAALPIDAAAVEQRIKPASAGRSDMEMAS